MKSQFLALWSDLRAWVATHPVIAGMAAALAILTVIAVCR